MTFYDYVKIYVKGGDGGNGMVAFRREKYVPFGGPAGGDGGAGGNVVFTGTSSLNTLADFKYKQHYKAPRGEHGQSKTQHGKKGEDMLVEVPLGTIVRDDGDGSVLADIVKEGQRVVVAAGGRGGRGNARFLSAKNRAPQIAENGEPGQERWLRLELKIMADVGLIGMPNAGKSTLLSHVSAARPKIGDYPFTTLAPNLAVVQLEPGVSFAMADLPGLIRGAASGAGLGHRFLRHVERTRLLIHVLDMAPAEGTPWEHFRAINDELQLYRQDLAQRAQIIAANKMDLPEAKANLTSLKRRLRGKYEIFPISAATGDGLKDLMWRAWQLLSEEQLPPPVAVSEEKLTKVTASPDFMLSRDLDGGWLVTGEKVEKLVIMTDWNNEAALTRLQNILLKIGLDQALRQAGAREGDWVRIAGQEFNFVE